MARLDGDKVAGIVRFDGISKSFTSVQIEEFSRSSLTTVMPIPGEEPLIMDLGGYEEQISVSGTQIVNSNDERKEFVNFLRGCVSGGQSMEPNYSSYTSDTLGGSFSVIVQDVRINWNAGEPNIIRFNIVMLVGEMI